MVGAADHGEGREESLEVEEPSEAPAVVRSREPQPPEAFSGATEATRAVRVRLAQRFFRRSVLASYDWRCCISDIALRPLLIASHILPWSDFPEHRADPRNGLCLSRMHDAAFDRGLIAFDDDRRLLRSKELRDATTNRVLSESFLPFAGQPLRLPEKFQPASSFLSRHREKVYRDS